MAGYKNAAGGSQNQADYLMQLMMQQMNGGAGAGAEKKPKKKREDVQMIDTTKKQVQV